MNEGAPKTKEELMKEKIEAVRGRLDRIGGEMDPEIIETVALVNLFGLPTHGSCGGHLDHGLANPWIAVTALGEPEYKYVGEEAVRERIAAKFGITTKDIRRGKNEDADEEFHSWLRGNDIPFTPEFEEWRAKKDAVVLQATEIVRQYNTERNDPEAVHVQHGRISVGVDEKAPAESDAEGLAQRLKVRQAVMAEFTEYLRKRYLDAI